MQEAVDFLKEVKFYPAGKEEGEEDAAAEVMQVKKAREHIYEWYMDILQNEVDYKKEAIHKVEQEGIVFIDEIDKLGAN